MAGGVGAHDFGDRQGRRRGVRRVDQLHYDLTVRRIDVEQEVRSVQCQRLGQQRALALRPQGHEALAPPAGQTDAVLHHGIPPTGSREARFVRKLLAPPAGEGPLRNGGVVVVLMVAKRDGVCGQVDAAGVPCTARTKRQNHLAGSEAVPGRVVT